MIDNPFPVALLNVNVSDMSTVLSISRMPFIVTVSVNEFPRIVFPLIVKLALVITFPTKLVVASVIVSVFASVLTSVAPLFIVILPNLPFNETESLESLPRVVLPFTIMFDVIVTSPSPSTDN